jgi:hypothetical protein
LPRAPKAPRRPRSARSKAASPEKDRQLLAVFFYLRDTCICISGDNHLAKPNYSFEKRQRELAKKKKQEEKRQRKASDKADKPVGPDTDAAIVSTADTPPVTS